MTVTVSVMWMTMYIFHCDIQSFHFEMKCNFGTGAISSLFLYYNAQLLLVDATQQNCWVSTTQSATIGDTLLKSYSVWTICHLPNYTLLAAQLGQPLSGSGRFAAAQRHDKTMEFCGVGTGRAVWIGHNMPRQVVTTVKAVCLECKTLMDHSVWTYWQWPRSYGHHELSINKVKHAMARSRYCHGGSAERRPADM